MNKGGSEMNKLKRKHMVIGMISGFGLILFFGFPLTGFGEIGDILRGASLFDKNCVICHGSTAKGDGLLSQSLPVQPANLTDCRLTAEDPVEVLEGIIREGGTYSGRSSVMPAWGDKLSKQEISDVAGFVKTLCEDQEWLTGALNFPRPLITGKAFPEQEIIVGGKFAQGDTNKSSQSLDIEYRIDGLTNIEVSTSAARVDPRNQSANSGIGDSSISVRRVLAFNYAQNYLVAAGLKLQFPTGDEDKGLGSGETTWQPSLRAGWQRGHLVTQVDTRVTIPSETSDENAKVRYNLALGYLIEPDPRLQVTPMIEITNESRINGPNSGDTLSTVVPQIRIKWLKWSTGLGVQMPVTQRKDFVLRTLFDLTYEYLLF